MKFTLSVPSGGEAEIFGDGLDAASGVRGFAAFLKGLHSAPDPEGDACPYCGWTQQKCQETGFVGCSLCYSSLKVLRRGPTLLS